MCLWFIKVLSTCLWNSSCRFCLWLDTRRAVPLQCPSNWYPRILRYQIVTDFLWRTFEPRFENTRLHGHWWRRFVMSVLRCQAVTLRQKREVLMWFRGVGQDKKPKWRFNFIKATWNPCQEGGKGGGCPLGPCETSDEVGKASCQVQCHVSNGMTNDSCHSASGRLYTWYQTPVVVVGFKW